MNRNRKYRPRLWGEISSEIVDDLTAEAGLTKEDRFEGQPRLKYLCFVSAVFSAVDEIAEALTQEGWDVTKARVVARLGTDKILAASRRHFAKQREWFEYQQQEADFIEQWAATRTPHADPHNVKEQTA